ncbi:MAG: DUF4126 domain-containing protein [Thermodesulfobacteriota bacterium]
METVLGIASGIGLSAACGFRIFVPLLIINLASLSGHLQLSPGFDWMGSYYCTVAFGTATFLEVLAYYIPWLDHFLDLIASPAAIMAGIMATASIITDMSPFLKWALALIAGGGAAANVQGITVALRTKSTYLTAGTANWFLSSLELVGSVITAILAIIAPLLSIMLIVLLGFFVIKKVGHFFLSKVKIK